MNTSYAFDAYRSHDLNISMKTSSGDTIAMDFSNQQSASYSQAKTQNSSSTSMSFSSMQSFSFSVQSNGIDAQDKKEIAEFMKTAQPFIDGFLEELQEDAPKTPVTKLAHQVASMFNPNSQNEENKNNFIKTNIVKMFDNAVNDIKPTQEIIDKIFEDTQKLLEKILKEFDDFNQLGNKNYA